MEIPKPLKPFDKKQAKMGMEVEKEHEDVTNGDETITAKIAAAHLKEDPAYYTKLKKMEKTFPKDESEDIKESIQKGFPKFESTYNQILQELNNKRWKPRQ